MPPYCGTNGIPSRGRGARVVHVALDRDARRHAQESVSLRILRMSDPRRRPCRLRTGCKATGSALHVTLRRQRRRQTSTCASPCNANESGMRRPSCRLAARTKATCVDPRVVLQCERRRQAGAGMSFDTTTEGDLVRARCRLGTMSEATRVLPTPRVAHCGASWLPSLGSRVCSILYGVQPLWAGRSTGSTEALNEGSPVSART